MPSGRSGARASINRPEVIKEPNLVPRVLIRAPQKSQDGGPSVCAKSLKLVAKYNTNY